MTKYFITFIVLSFLSCKSKPTYTYETEKKSFPVLIDTNKHSVKTEYYYDTFSEKRMANYIPFYIGKDVDTIYIVEGYDTEPTEYPDIILRDSVIKSEPRKTGFEKYYVLHPKLQYKKIDSIDICIEVNTSIEAVNFDLFRLF